MWDLFISHASEDKDDVVRPLAQKLSDAGLRVWFDEQTLRVGDSLRRKIDEGLAKSTFGVVVLSPHFFDKEWPARELNGLFSREESGDKVILPVWHNVTDVDVARRSPLAASKVAVSTSRGLDKVVQEILAVVRPLQTEREQDFRKRKARLSEDSTSNLNKLQQVPTPVIDLDARFEPSDGPEGLRPAAVDIADRVARSIQPYVEVRIRAIEFVQEEITVLERVTPRSETENRKLAGLKTRLQWLVQKRELFLRAIEVVLSNVKIRGFHKVPFDGRTISDIILGLRDWIFIGNSGSGQYEWCLSKVGYPLQVSLLISDTEHRRMFTGMVVGDQSMRTLAQIQEQEGHFPMEWLDSDILFRKAVPAIIVAVLQHTELGSSSDKIEGILDWPSWRVLLRSPNR